MKHIRVFEYFWDFRWKSLWWLVKWRKKASLIGVVCMGMMSKSDKKDKSCQVIRWLEVQHSSITLYVCV